MTKILTSKTQPYTCIVEDYKVATYGEQQCTLAHADGYIIWSNTGWKGPWTFWVDGWNVRDFTQKDLEDYFIDLL